MLFSWAPAELLLLFLPPRPREDSLSKQALSLPSDGETAFRTDAVGLLFFFLIHSGMPTNKVFTLLEGGSQARGKPFKRIMSRLVFHAVVVLFILHQ